MRSLLSAVPATALLTSLAIFVAGTVLLVSELGWIGVIVGAATFILIASAVNHRLCTSYNQINGEARRLGASAANAGLMALAYGWGGGMLLFGYGVAALSWRHDWQYGLGMVLIAGLLLALRSAFKSAVKSGSAGQLLAVSYRLTQLQLVAAASGLVFLAGSGKLASVKADWAANQVFLAGGVVIVVLSALAIRTHRALAAR